MKHVENHEQIKEKIVTAANMPKDVVLGASVVTMLGDFEVCIEKLSGNPGIYRYVNPCTNERKADPFVRKTIANGILYK